MHFASLTHTPISQITACFNKAFSDYFVAFHATEDYFRDRWQAAGVDYGLSVGAFDGEKLVGFMILCTGTKDGLPTAHNAGTGVIPAYRGRRLVAAMYDYVRPKLKTAGIRQSTLEVITQNEKAIKAYERVGYHIIRKVHCFSGRVNQMGGAATKDGQVIKTQHIDWPLLIALPPHRATWEQRPEVIAARAALYECWQLWEDGHLKAYIILNPATGQMQAFSAVAGGELRYGLPLIQAIGHEIPTLSINNVDEQENGWLAVFEQAGLNNAIDQYEMKWML